MTVDKNSKTSPENIVDIVKSTFSHWLSGTATKTKNPKSVIEALSHVSERLLERRITYKPIWEMTKYKEFFPIYKKARDDKFFKVLDKETYLIFMNYGNLYLKFLKTNPEFKAVATELETPPLNDSAAKIMTIKEAVIKVLLESDCAMTANEIYDKIVEQDLYVFGAQNPVSVVQYTVDRSCDNSSYSDRNRAPVPCFHFEKDRDGKRVYSLLEEVQISKTGMEDNSGNEALILHDSNLIIWNQEKEKKFQEWLERENYAPRTVYNYRRAITQIFNDYSLVSQRAINGSKTELEAIRSLVALLNNDGNYVKTNVARHNQLSAALSALERFYSEGLDFVDNMGVHMEESKNNTPFIPEELTAALSCNYINGFRFDTTSVRLLSEMSGIDITIPMQNVLKSSMFRRADDIYFLLDNVASEEIRQEIILQANDWLDCYGFFEISELYGLFVDQLNGISIIGVEDFEAFYELINTRYVRCVSCYDTRVARISKNIADLSADIAATIVLIAHEEHGGVIDEDELKSRFAAFSAGMLSKIIKQCAEELVKTEINGIVCYQTIDALGLPDNFSEELFETISRIVELDLTLSQEVLNTALSLKLGVNFRNEYSVLDDRTFRRLVSMYYKAEPRREWKGGIFMEVSV